MSVRQDNELRVGRNGVALPRDVLVDDVPVAGRTDGETRAFRYRRQKERINWRKEILRIFIGLLATLVAFILIVASLGLAYGSVKMTGVLRDIGKRDFGDAVQRFERYDARFGAMKEANSRVLSSEPKIVSGVTKYLWVVQPRGSDDRIVYRWKHDLNTNTVEPMTNPALLMDIALGFISPSDAAMYSFYDPGDKLAQSLAQGDPGQFGTYSQPNIQGLPLLPGSPVVAPLVDPDKARSRSRGKAVEEEEPTEEDPNAPVVGDETVPNESTDVGGGVERRGDDEADEETGGGDDDAGDSSEVQPGDGGDDNGGGEEPEPPDSDAVPVE
jgi:hypothetical protein